MAERTEQDVLNHLVETCRDGKRGFRFAGAVQGLVAAGEIAHKAALTKNLNAMLEVGETISNACAACHDKFRTSI